MVVEKPHIHAHFIELLDDLDHVRRIAAKPVQLRDQDNVAFLNFYLQGMKARTVRITAGRFIGRISAVALPLLLSEPFICNSKDCWLVETRAYPKSRINVS